jgi:hypothetical protein
MRPYLVCFIPCCKSKFPSGRIEGGGERLTEEVLPNMWNSLARARNEMHKIADDMENVYIAIDSPETSAIHLYRGTMYTQFNLNSILQEIRAGYLRLFIISAWYGIVDAFEPLHRYEAKMQGRIAEYWRNHNLDEIICDLLLTLRPSAIFGFFAGNEYWYGSGAKYRYFFTRGLSEALNEGLDTLLSGCFHRLSGFGSTAILGALGRTFMDFLRSRFSEEFVLNIARNKRIDGSIVIGFKHEG